MRRAREISVAQPVGRALNSSLVCLQDRLGVGGIHIHGDLITACKQIWRCRKWEQGSCMATQTHSYQWVSANSYVASTCTTCVFCVFPRTCWGFSRAQELLSALYTSDPASRAYGSLQAGNPRTVIVLLGHTALYDALMSSLTENNNLWTQQSSPAHWI